MKHDIQSREDIIKLVETFYSSVLKDKVISHFFTEVADISWEHHMPIMYNFWESVLLDNPVYKGNPMTKHIALDGKSRIDDIHFDRWEELFCATLDDLYTGEKVELAKKRAGELKALMKFKVQQSRNNLFIQ